MISSFISNQLLLKKINLVYLIRKDILNNLMKKIVT